MSKHNTALLAIFIAAVLWASAGVSAKFLFLEVSPFVAIFHRFGLASLIILPFFLRTKKPKHYIRHLLPLGLLNAGNVLLYFSGLSLTTANTAAILGTAVPITTAVLSPLVIHEPVEKGKYFGILIGLAGALFIVLLPILDTTGTFNGSITGNVLLVGSLLCWTLYILYSRYILSSGTYSPILSTSVNLFTVMVAGLLASLLTRQPLITSALTHTSYLGILTYAAIGITIVTFFLFQWGVQHVSAATASLKEYVQLVLGVGLNMLFLGEQITGTYLLGSALIVLGILIATGLRISRRLASVLFSQTK